VKRREFITLLGGAAAAWPLAARAQQPERMRRIGVLMSAVEGHQRGLESITAFAQGLAELGWTVGRNVRIEYRWGAGDLERFRRYAAELVALSPDVVLATAGSIVGAFQQASRTVPIVFVTTIDPVGGGWVESLSRPGTNATGFAAYEFSMSGKRLELLKEIAPDTKNDDNVFMLKMRLELLGDFEVLTAEDGEKGCAMAVSERPDIILMDLEMPVVDGWEATRRLKGDPQTRDIPVIALSAHALAGEREKALAAGCNEFDTKPIEFDRLVATVRRILANAK
jgi:CheY-like chemotaxis protein